MSQHTGPMTKSTKVVHNLRAHRSTNKCETIRSKRNSLLDAGDKHPQQSKGPLLNTRHRLTHKQYVPIKQSLYPRSFNDHNGQGVSRCDKTQRLPVSLGDTPEPETDHRMRNQELVRSRKCFYTLAPPKYSSLRFFTVLRFQRLSMLK